MNATATTAPGGVGDWDIRSIGARGYDLMFAPDELSDSAISAASRAQAKFSSPFPAWQAYRTIINGTTAHHVELVEYATGVGLATLLRSDAAIRKRGIWVVAASQDAMVRTVTGSFPMPAITRATEYGLTDKTYSRVRNAVAQAYMGAVDEFCGILHDEARAVLRIDGRIR